LVRPDSSHRGRKKNEKMKSTSFETWLATIIPHDVLLEKCSKTTDRPNLAENLTRGGALELFSAGSPKFEVMPLINCACTDNNTCKHRK